jgi:integrase
MCAGAMLTAGLVDRAIDQWETEFGRSTIKNTVSALVLVLDEAVRDGIIPRNPATDRARRRTVGRSSGHSEPSTPRDLALPNVAILEQLVARVVEAGNDQSWGDVVTILATTALRISEVSGLRVGDIDLVRGLIHVHRQTYPGHGGLVTKETKGRRRRTVPIIDPLRPTLVRLTAGRGPEERLVLGPRGGVITTATLRDATGWDALVHRARATGPGPPRPSAHRPDLDGRRWRRSAHPAAGRRTSGSGSRGSLPASRCAGHAGGWHSVFGVVVRSWSGAAIAARYRRRQECRLNTGPTRSDGVHRFGRAGEI